ncbi:HECT E3 ubiquitin ligase, putative [Phytophthora infestans T30-4]|uniref:HECT-type E3 ubiquitin transferase n=2 Tax=Phytophthora infestans TaxID=4787 RepID=D0MTZ8_PHYIT|nr:HECT E3 ubiquitin ligase, putative [Phytophthora infestans T30-4]XP_002909991.1 HECT E3 ubiquitin ligase, putative [Phytophthora infestans T30-4]EEY61445.1 HECT E3 ubiquitin ligase, putative [Phytophthora infestans T30-4]EEY67457.1 HECT E3 ubiquitin ligase, putative [Phytophthora infestans T30-4]KAF4144832.1 Ubiquitin-transferase HECT domain-containing protein [Phytophthora infestans]|eukprot:XP_002908362.1 HECT E3 ubiquitin ligase, putative [Phytophthora infestans T30-4]
MDGGVLAILVNVSFVAVLAIAFFMMRRKLIRVHTRRLRELAAPLLGNPLTTNDHRLDTATREAEKGFEVCAVCEFENFKDALFCSLCGERMKKLEASDNSNKNKRKRRRKEKKDRKTNERATILPRHLTERQLRARKRKEWTRKLDVEGNMFWFRVKEGSGPIVPARVGKVIRFVKPNENLKMPGQVNGPIAIQSEVAVVEPAKAKVFKEMADMDIIPATKWDAAARATGEVLEDDTQTGVERRRETLELAAKDFPSKYAYFVKTTASLLVPPEVEFLKLSLHRDYMFEESMEHLGCIEEKYIRSAMRINFLEENGVDAGGLHREWFMMLTELLTDPETGLFKATNGEDRAFFLNSNSRYDNGEEHLIYLYGAGRLLGRALLEGTVLNFHLCVPLLKLILGTPLCMDDVKYFDPEVYQSMTWMLENDGVEALDLDFSVMERVGDRTMTVDLIPNGRNVEVTDANTHEYLERKFEHLLLRSVADQLYVFLKGIYEVIPLHLLVLFDYEELDYLMCGSPEIDVDDWEKNASVAESVARSPTLAWFWEIVREMPNEYRRRLLQFTTGCSRVPLVGFKGLTSYDGKVCLFTIRGIVGAPDEFVRSYACFNRLDLPLGISRSELKRMLYAVLDTEQYGFTTD